jgi:hypothetical protein
LKITGTTYWNATNNADNSSGFSALGGGYYTNNYYGLKTESRWWTDTSLKYRSMTNSSTATTTGTGISDNAFYIRCRK